MHTHTQILIESLHGQCKSAPGPDDVGGSEIDDGEREQALWIKYYECASLQC